MRKVFNFVQSRDGLLGVAAGCCPDVLHQNQDTMSLYPRLSHYMGTRRWLLPLSLVLSALVGLLSLVPFVLIWFIVRALLEGDATSVQAVWSYALWAAGTALLGVLLYFVSLLLSHVAAFRLEVNLRREAMQRLMQLPLGFFAQQESGQLRKVIDEDSSSTHTFVAHILPDLSGSIMAPLAVMVLLFVFDWRLGVACLVPILAAMVTMAVMMNPKQNDFQRHYLDAQEAMSNEAVEYVRGIPVVKTFQQSVFSFKRFYKSIILYRDLVTRYTLGWQRPMSFYTTAMVSFAFLLVPLAVLLMGRAGENAAVLVADLLLYMLIVPIITSHVMKVMYLQRNLFLAGECIARIERISTGTLLATQPLYRHQTDHSVCLDNVSFRYPESTSDAVSQVSFTIPQGQTYALVGASGGGKTTIARLIPRFWDVNAGSVSIGGIDVRNMEKEALMAQVAFVFQNTRLFHASLRDNILYGAPHATEEQVQRAIDLSQSRDIIDRLPQGLDTIIGAEGTYLSGGERQRIALARALLKDAPIVVLDEATAFADPENEALIHRALRALMRGKTTLMIAHRLSTVQQADCILVVDGGRVVERGTHDQLLEQGGRYAQMWNDYQQSVAWTL